MYFYLVDGRLSIWFPIQNLTFKFSQKTRYALTAILSVLNLETVYQSSCCAMVSKLLAGCIFFLHLHEIVIEIEWVMTSLWRHLSFLQTIVNISNSIYLQTSYLEPIHNNIHLMIKMKVTLTNDKVTGKSQRSQKMN